MTHYFIYNSFDYPTKKGEMDRPKQKDFHDANHSSGHRGNAITYSF